MEGVSIEETNQFLELHANGEVRQNCLVRSKKQFRWLGAIDRLRREGLYIDASKEIKTWAGGVVYGAAPMWRNEVEP